MERTADQWAEAALAFAARGEAAMYVTAALKAGAQPLEVLSELEREASAAGNGDILKSFRTTSQRLDRLLGERALGSSTGWLARRSKQEASEVVSAKMDVLTGGLYGDVDLIRSGATRLGAAPDKVLGDLRNMRSLTDFERTQLALAMRNI